MKRLISIMLVVVLLMGCMATMAFAAEEPILSGDHVTAEAGGTATVTFSISEITYQDYGLKIVYGDGLTIASVKEGTASHGTFGYGAKSDKVAVFDSVEVTTSGPLFTVTFNVPSDAKVGDKYDVTVEIDSFRNEADEYLTVEVSAGSITIVHNHSWNEGEVTTPATCVDTGVKTYTCSKCGETKTEVIPAAGHSWGEWTTTKEATCAAKGEKTRTCSVCGEKETEEISATGNHTWGEWTTTKEATCTAKGEKTRTCSVCGATERTDIPMIPHDYGWEYDDTNHWLVCSACGDTTEKEAHEHNIKGDDGYYYCECGHKGDKIPVHVPGDDSGKDEVPKTGDITPQIAMGGFAIVIAMLVAIAFVFKRKTAK